MAIFFGLVIAVFFLLLGVLAFQYLLKGEN
jgi:hypothetical protein